MKDLDARLRKAVRGFWKTRTSQGRKQGRRGSRDQGGRTAVTGGAQMSGFERLIVEMLTEVGLQQDCIHTRAKTLPGFFRPTKDWDLLVVVDKHLLASLEFKSQVGPSFGNNFNNRVEESVGSATDLWTAYREGAFRMSPRPWLGYLMLLEETERSTNPVRVSEPHFEVFKPFKQASYAKRYQILCERLVRERLYDSACLILSSASDARTGDYREPSPELSFRNLAASLTGHVRTHSTPNPLG